MKIAIVVRDTPRPGGGKIAGFNKRTGKGFVRPDNPRTATWRNSVRNAALQQYSGKPIQVACRVDYRFYFRRPKNHYRTGKASHQLKSTAPTYHASMPDLTKLIRSTEDALKGIAWVDDRLCSNYSGGKYYADDDQPEGCVIMIEPLEARILLM